MRVFHAAALTAAAMLLASIGSAQGLGDAAAREKEKRKATPAQPAKVYTDREVATTPTSPQLDDDPEATPVPEAGGAGGSSASASDDAKTPEEKAAAEEEKAAADEAEARAKAEADWRSRLENERMTETKQTELIARLNADLGDLSSISYGPNRTRKLNLLEETQQKLAATRANIAGLEEEGRRNAYR
jgi:hypothetical protein